MTEHRPTSAERRLAAILSADAVGYTRLMSEDEAGTIRTLTTYREAIQSLVDQHHGRVVDSPGDNILAEFPNALDAVQCAVEIQSVLRVRNQSLPEQRRMLFRIGVHLGDVAIDGERIYGDGVNIAARLEGLADPAGICISATVHDQVESKLGLSYEDLGEQSVKNIAKPVRVFRVGAEAETAPTETRASSLLRVARTLAAAVVVAVILSTAWRMLAERPEEPVAADVSGPIRSIAVLPLDNLSGDPEQEYFADGMTEALISELGKVRSLRVISRTSAMQYKGVRKPVGEIARELSVDAVVEGSVLHAADRVRITAQLIDARADQHLWAESYNRDLRDVLALQSEVARTVAREVQVQLTSGEEARLSAQRPVDPQAYEAYLKGRHYWKKRTRDGFRRAIGYFEQAIGLDPGYAAAYAGLADAYVLASYYGLIPPREARPRAEAAATKALELDDTLAEAHTAFGLFRCLYYWDWSGAEQQFKRAIELNASYATAHHWLIFPYVATGRFEKSSQALANALRLDPLSHVIKTGVAANAYFARDYERAISLFSKPLEIDRGFAETRFTMAITYLKMSMPQQAVEEAEEAARISPSATRVMAYLGHVYAAAGRRTKALEVLADLLERSATEYISPYAIALVYSGLGDTDDALTSLEEAYEERTGELFRLNVDPIWDPLRSDPRFQDLLRRIGFPEDS